MRIGCTRNAGDRLALQIASFKLWQRPIPCIDLAGAVPAHKAYRFHAPSNHSNGNPCDREGRLVRCGLDSRRVTRTELDGRIAVLADGYEGKKPDAPDNITVASDGAIWFTDPGYGSDGEYEGHNDTFELPGKVYRAAPLGLFPDQKRPGLAPRPSVTLQAKASARPALRPR